MYLTNHVSAEAPTTELMINQRT